MNWTDRRAMTAGATAMLALLLSAPAAHAESGAPQLSISVENGQTSAADGDTLTYAIVVKNLGTTRIRDLHVSQTLPEGLDFTSADKSGARAHHTVVWTIDLAPTGKAVLHATMKVGETPADLLRLATVACAAMSPEKPPVVCATHSDELPAGAAVATDAQTSTGGSESTGLGSTQYAGLGVLTLVAALGGLVLLRRRSPRATS